MRGIRFAVAVAVAVVASAVAACGSADGPVGDVTSAESRAVVEDDAGVTGEPAPDASVAAEPDATEPDAAVAEDSAAPEDAGAPLHDCMPTAFTQGVCFGSMQNRGTSYFADCVGPMPPTVGVCQIVSYPYVPVGMSVWCCAY